MEYSIEDRLKRLKSRRMDASNVPLVNRGFVEEYDRRTNNQATRYALGAMQEVDFRSTEISIEEAQKVENALTERLLKHGYRPRFRLQGSVPMNTHIRGASDVDLLEIHGETITFAGSGPSACNYVVSTRPGTIADEVLAMRTASEEELTTHFWGAKVDRSNAKSIQLSEGGFRRKVDVVPSHWFDSVDYQRYQNEIFRGVGVINKDTKERHHNYPFLFRHHIDKKGKDTYGGAKMAIRLLKSLSADSKKDLTISSYDIASVVFHCPSNSIMRHVARDLAILSGISAFLNQLAVNRSQAEALMSPDGTRKIFDKSKKWNSFLTLVANTFQLAREVERELVGPSFLLDRDFSQVLKSLNESKIPIVPNH
ncbi:hypothetical protein [Limimaricola hongkongensis]|uniref:cGAS/DncV-like nucleotidyltransferase C-terminal helical domain-containing protein n=1 Tax=Limimaricola hongkongensis DSM 17492 TaxID=1122180 RepID=A0A017HB83_9RHOB|nr:hypothetical protein [Limimaricola hongkongensis]EYD71418.1 hypothetical protein Lokhon_03067 [Limimaricola hongkongensis DSM 17492]